MAALPPESNWTLSLITAKGRAGTRLSPKYISRVSDDLLREMAKESLGAIRCGVPYLRALRVVLGNQAAAERIGFVLEMNQRVDFAEPKIMRNVIGQMEASRLSFGRVVLLGPGQSQKVQCYFNRRERSGDSEERLEWMYRKAEGECPCQGDLPATICYEDLL